jgi:hypothetical protein
LYTSGPEAELFGGFGNIAQGNLLIARFVFESEGLERQAFAVVPGNSSQAFQGRILVESVCVRGAGGHGIITHEKHQDW